MPLLSITSEIVGRAVYNLNPLNGAPVERLPLFFILKEQNMSIDVKKIAQQNDKFRKTFCGGQVLLTYGISSLPMPQQFEITQKVKESNNFTEDNDPYGEHDFGCFEYKGQQIFWKIDLYDLNYEFYSPQPDDENQTNRTLTIMFAEEY